MIVVLVIVVMVTLKCKVKSPAEDNEGSDGSVGGHGDGGLLHFVVVLSKRPLKRWYAAHRPLK